MKAQLFLSYSLHDKIRYDDIEIVEHCVCCGNDTSGCCTIPGICECLSNMVPSCDCDCKCPTCDCACDCEMCSCCCKPPFPPKEEKKRVPVVKKGAAGPSTQRAKK